MHASRRVQRRLGKLRTARRAIRLASTLCESIADKHCQRSLRHAETEPELKRAKDGRKQRVRRFAPTCSLRSCRPAHSALCTPTQSTGMRAALHARRRPPSMSIVPTQLGLPSLDSPLPISPGPSSAAIKFEASEQRRSRQRHRRAAIVALAAFVSLVLLAIGTRHSRQAPDSSIRPPSLANLRVYIYDLPPWLDREVRLASYVEDWLRHSKEYDSDVVRARPLEASTDARSGSAICWPCLAIGRSIPRRRRSS